jgi:hypothetical protein
VSSGSGEVSNRKVAQTSDPTAHMTFPIPGGGLTSTARYNSTPGRPALDVAMAVLRWSTVFQKLSAANRINQLLLGPDHHCAIMDEGRGVLSSH